MLNYDTERQHMTQVQSGVIMFIESIAHRPSVVNPAALLFSAWEPDGFLLFSSIMIYR